MTAVYGPSALLTPANALTLARIAVAPLAFAVMMDTEASWGLFALWILLSASDGVDGHVARRHGTTRSGAFLDPLADKVLVLGGFAALASTGRFPWAVVWLTAIREVAVSLFRSYHGRRGLAVPASRLAKGKTFSQLAAVALVVLPVTNGVEWLADGVLWFSIAVAWASAAQYFASGRAATTTMGVDTVDPPVVT